MTSRNIYFVHIRTWKSYCKGVISIYHELPGIRPSRSIKAFDSDPPLILQLPFINYIRGLLPMFRDYVFWRKSRCSLLKLFNREFTECRQITRFTLLLIFCQTSSELFSTASLMDKNTIHLHTSFMGFRNWSIGVQSPTAEGEFRTLASHLTIAT